ncbi:hypothetical protein [Paenibacillus phocaensis]|uniref:hypothetical protein n=1 Tax=Paenibacillus phocaensis TaxID=1776378 RepID=UPI000839C4FD|nr:hypothetical protein [Paenibacillus phocaensis]
MSILETSIFDGLNDLKDNAENLYLQHEKLKIQRMNAEARLINAQLRAQLMSKEEKSLNEPLHDNEMKRLLEEYAMLEQMEQSIEAKKDELQLSILKYKEQSGKKLTLSDRYLKRYYFQHLRDVVLKRKMLPEPDWSDDMSVLLWWNKLLPMLDADTIEELWMYFLVDEKDRVVEQTMRKMLEEQRRRLIRR